MLNEVFILSILILILVVLISRFISHIRGYKLNRYSEFIILGPGDGADSIWRSFVGERIQDADQSRKTYKNTDPPKYAKYQLIYALLSFIFIIVLIYQLIRLF